MFFKKDKDFIEKPENIIETPAQDIPQENTESTIENFLSKNPEDTEFPYSFHKVEPYPMDLISVITKMLQKLFPDTRKAYLMEARQNKKRGYLLIVDIEPKFLKIINIYADGETKKVRGDVPIECILYSKSGTITEGIDPFFVKETAESKANNLASKEFSGEIVFSDMPEFELWKNTDKKAVHSDDENGADVLSPLNEENEEAVSEETVSEETATEVSQSENNDSPEENIESSQETENTQYPHEKLSPSDKKELFAILKEYAEKASESATTLASAAIKEFVFCIPYSCKDLGFINETGSVLPIDETLKFEVLVNPEDEKISIPLYTNEDEALEFADKINCRVAVIKYKDFASSLAAERTQYDAVVINPNSECIILPADHILLAE